MLSCLAVSAATTVEGQVGLSLEDAVRQALERHPSIQLARADAQAALADLTAAGQPFAPRLRTFVENAHEEQVFASESARPGDRFIRHTLDTGVVLERTLRSGLALASELSFSRAQLPPDYGVDASTSTNLRLGLTLPLLAGRGGGFEAVAERAAAGYLESSQAAARHVASLVVFDAIAAYWQWVAARRQLDVYQESEARAQQLINETKVLIQADERAPSELDLIAANLASKHAARLGAAQRFREAQHQLALAAGAAAFETLASDSPATAFPDVSTALVSPDAVDKALGLRQDLQALTARIAAARLTRDRAGREVTPRLDLRVAGLYNGQPIEGGAKGSLQPFHGFGATWQIVYEPTFAWSATRGRALRTDADYVRGQATLDDATRRVRSQAALAAEALVTSRGELEANREAVRRSLAAVETEQKKFHAGLATVFDAILAADTLTNTSLGEIDAHARYAITLARLGFATGRLVRFDSAGMPHLDPAWTR